MIDLCVVSCHNCIFIYFFITNFEQILVQKISLRLTHHSMSFVNSSQTNKHCFLQVCKVLVFFSAGTASNNENILLRNSLYFKKTIHQLKNISTCDIPQLASTRKFHFHISTMNLVMLEESIVHTYKRHNII